MGLYDTVKVSALKIYSAEKFNIHPDNKIVFDKYSIIPIGEVISENA